jgi:hypothetical protein
MFNETVNAALERHAQCQNLKPWPKGVSGNPGGLRSNGKRYRALYEAQEAALVAHHGRALTARETLLLDELVDLKVRKCTGLQDPVKRANSLDRLLRALYGDGKPKATPGEALDAHLAQLASEGSP